jgi:hypothetical protein
MRTRPTAVPLVARAFYTSLPLVLSTACATIIHGRTQEITVTSAPSGAQVFIDKSLIGITPARILLKRRESHLVLRFEKDGYIAENIALKRSFSGWAAADIGLGAVQLANQGITTQPQRIGAAAGILTMTLGVDLITGSAYKLPAHVQVTLKTLLNNPR